MEVISHKFNNWKEIPDITHLLNIKNNSVKAFHGKIVHVAYIIHDQKIVAFGSAGYYSSKNNYYVDCDDGDEYEYTRQLWIEGLVSTMKGCGTLVLQELEKCLIVLSNEYNVTHKIINIMSVSDAVGFYENNGYNVCITAPYWGGVDCTRVAKSINNYPLITANIINYDKLYNSSSEDDLSILAWQLAGAIIINRRKFLSGYMNLPKDIILKDIENFDNYYKITNEFLIMMFVKCLDDLKH
jgi:hypothetical protein